MEIEVHGLGLDVVQKSHEIGEAAAKAVHAPRHDLIEILAGHSFEQGVVAGAPVTAFDAADAFVGEGGDHFPALSFGHGQQVTKLVLDGLVLIRRRNTSIDRHALGQGRSPIQSWENRLSWIDPTSTELGLTL